MSKIKKGSIRSLAFSCLLVLLGIQGCNQESGPSQREITISLLTQNSTKKWVFDQISIDGQTYTPTICDNAYRLVLKSDFTWNEFYVELQCNQPTEGQWSLNEENDVVSISYLNPISGNTEERHFEIEELSEDYFAYQYAINNKLKYVRLKWGGWMTLV